MPLPSAAELEGAGAIRDAARLVLRRLGPEDREALRGLFYRLSPESIYRRFLTPLARPEQAQPDRLLDLDHVHREAIGAFSGAELVGVARYARAGESGGAEIAAVVADEWQGHGVGILLLERLRQEAREAGIATFTGMALADNSPVLGLLRKFDPDFHPVLSDGLMTWELPVRRSPGR